MSWSFVPWLNQSLSEYFHNVYWDVIQDHETTFFLPVLLGVAASGNQSLPQPLLPRRQNCQFLHLCRATLQQPAHIYMHCVILTTAAVGSSTKCPRLCNNPFIVENEIIIGPIVAEINEHK